MKFKPFLIIVILLLSGQWLVKAQDNRTLTVFAAASLTDAFEEIATSFEGENPGVELLLNFGGSSALATQLAEGAPADIFASANNRQMQVAQEAGRIADSPRTFVKNRLVLIVPADNPANLQSLRDLANPGIKLIVAAPEVPVREYTDTMLQKLADDPGYGETYRTAVIANIVSEEDNVRQVSAKVALGEADAGIIYLSDVTPDISELVFALPIPDKLNTIATYPIATTEDSVNPQLAQAFVDFVLSDAGQDTLVKWGFISVRIPELPPLINIATDGALYVEGQVLNPLMLTLDDLKINYTPLAVEVSYLSGEESVTTTFTGALLYDVLSDAQANFNTDVKNDKLSTFIVATGSDDYQAVISWGEIDPEFADEPVLIAYEQENEPISEEGPFRLIVPTDERGGCYVSNLVNLSLRDAPTIAS